MTKYSPFPYYCHLGSQSSTKALLNVAYNDENATLGEKRNKYQTSVKSGFVGLLRHCASPMHKQGNINDVNDLTLAYILAVFYLE